MSWVKLDDGWAMHAKVRALRTSDAIALWVISASMTAQRQAEGLVPADMVDIYALMAHADRETATGELVASGLWHDAKTMRRCSTQDREGRTCREGLGRVLRDGEFYFHHWLDEQPVQAVDNGLAKVRDLRKKALHRNTRLTNAIRERDLDLCRYCSVMVTFGNDHKSPTSGTFDHVDPFYELDGPTRGNTIDNVVVACRQCNSEKRDRTPEQWVEVGGRPLQPVPDSGWIRSGFDADIPDTTRPGSRKTRTSRARTREAGRAGSNPGSGSDMGRIR